MGNRSRRERRAAQAQRAVDAQDPRALDTLIATNPEMAAQHLARALSSLPADQRSPLDVVAGDLCFRLRRSGKLEVAHRLALACAHRSKRLRLESALAAFALGRDAEAERSASADEDVAGVLAPLLEAARSVAGRVPRADDSEPVNPVGPPTRPRGRRDRRPAAVRALHEAAAAAKATAAGEVVAGRAALRRIPPALATTVLRSEMSAAIDLLEPHAPRFRGGASHLALSRDVRTSAPASEALVRALASHDAALALETATRLGLAEAQVRPIRIRALMRAMAAGPQGADPRARQVANALELAGAAGADAFDVPHRAAACLYEGFAVLRSDPKRAGKAFDRAVELGGDLLEALRGKLLVALADMGERCPGCGGYHGDTEHKGRDVGAAADRFARAARRLPSGAPFAVAASLIAAEGWDADRSTKAALASIDVARAAAGDTLRDELDLREAHVVARERPERAIRLLDGLLARDPGSARAWRMKIELARDRGERARADDLVVQAAAATREPELETRARRIRAERGEIRPFDGFVPGTTTAGALAAEAAPLMRRPGPSPALPEIAIACRAALSPDAQLALDVALLCVEAEAGKPAEAAKRLGSLLALWWTSPRSLARFAAAMWLVGLEGRLAPAARPLAHDAGAGPALGALTDAAIAAEDKAVAESLLRLGGGLWTRTETQERMRAIARLSPTGITPFPPSPNGGTAAAPNPDEARDEIRGLLAPEFRLFQGAGNDDDDDDDDDDVPAVLREAFDALRLLGLSKREIAGLGPAKLMQLVDVMQQISESGLHPAKLKELERAVLRIVGKR